MRKVLVIAVFAALTLALMVGTASAIAPSPSYGSAVVDGDPGEWDLTNDFFVHMYRAGKPDKPVESKAYLRYDCATGTMYVLVLAVDGIPVKVLPDDAWGAIDAISNKVYNGFSGNDGTPPDFAWINQDGEWADGYEASFSIDEGSYWLWIHVQVQDGEQQTSAAKAIRLIIECDTQPLVGRIAGVKYQDANINGELDPLDTLLGGWLIELYNDEGDFIESTFTDPVDGYEFTDLPLGKAYVVKESMPGTTWMQTGPKNSEGQDVDPLNPNAIVVAKGDGVWLTTGYSARYEVELLDNGEDACTDVANFGNVCITSPRGGYTIGYWSNKNGQKVLSDNDTAWRTEINAFCLRDAAGNDYDVPAGAFNPAYTSFRNWLLGANSVDMSYMLSAQLAATKLNTLYKGLDAEAHLILPSGLADCYGSTTAYVGQAIAQANAALCNDASRSTQECFKNILDGINNNCFAFISSEPCDVSYSVED